MYQYYAAPIRREQRSLYANPLGGACILAHSPHEACIRLGLPDPGQMFVIWALSPEVDLEKAGEICSLVPPTRAYVSLGDGVIYPLGLDMSLDLHMEGPHAGSD